MDGFKVGATHGGIGRPRLKGYVRKRLTGCRVHDLDVVDNTDAFLAFRDILTNILAGDVCRLPSSVFESNTSKSRGKEHIQ